MSVERSNNTQKRGSNALLMFLLPIAALAGGGIGWLWHSSAGSNSSRASTNRLHSVMHLDTFVLNLSGADDRAYLRAGIDLGLRSNPRKDSDPTNSVGLVRDTILGVLATARPEEVLTFQGKQTLKGNILRALRERAPDLEVEEVYFTEILIQR
jgi:flagellar basal body-associated protein FliL